MLILFKILLVAALFFMIFNLFKALIIMNKHDPSQPSSSQPKMSKYIGRRVLISVIIVISLLIAIATGLITPNPTPR